MRSRCKETIVVANRDFKATYRITNYHIRSFAYILCRNASSLKLTRVINGYTKYEL